MNKNKWNRELKNLVNGKCKEKLKTKKKTNNILIKRKQGIHSHVRWGRRYFNHLKIFNDEQTQKITTKVIGVVECIPSVRSEEDTTVRMLQCIKIARRGISKGRKY